MKIPVPVEAETFDVFDVQQLTRATSLESVVAVDVVDVVPHQVSEIHRHNNADTVLYIVAGEANVIVDDTKHAVRTGDRVHIPPGAFHGVVTEGVPLRFLSVQTPPILCKETGNLDLEYKNAGDA
ncbi:MAG: cupin domain-containing protein [Alphaproteobacteria bacterium]|nr:cupin domain-containing protein [Alphaproteobacteria bacterium]